MAKFILFDTKESADSCNESIFNMLDLNNATSWCLVEETTDGKFAVQYPFDDLINDSLYVYLEHIDSVDESTIEFKRG